MTNADDPIFKTADWLAAHINDAGVKVIDATWLDPNVAGPNAYDYYKDDHIPGAVFFDHNKLWHPDRARASVPLDIQTPSAKAFVAEMTRLGISNDDHVVIYDGDGVLTAPRLWWMFKAYGHDNVSILDGGALSWRVAGHPTESGPMMAYPATTPYRADPQPAWYKSFDDVQAPKDAKIVDIRQNPDEEEAFLPGYPAGRIPHSVHIPFFDIVEEGPRGFSLKDADTLRQVFHDAGLSADDDVIVSCAVGMMAPLAALAFYRAAFEAVNTGDISPGKAPEISVYDGSWVDWATRSGLQPH